MSGHRSTQRSRLQVIKTLALRSLFFFLLISVFHSISVRKGNGETERTTLSSASLVIHASEADIQKKNHPTIPAPKPFEVPVNDENESNDGADEEVSKLWGNFYHLLQHSVNSRKRLFGHLRDSNENRPSISLVILYQCWKSFL